MSIEVGGVNPLHNLTPVNAPSAAQTSANPEVTAADDDTDAVSLDTMPASPPPEVMQAISDASSAFDRLQDAGQQLHFSVDAPTRRLTVEVHDLDGNVQGTVSASQVLEVAGGASLS
jgi:hypothetical protein